MILDVPLIRQEKDTVDCGIVGMAMLLKYYGIDVSYEDIKKEIKIHEIGTYAPQLGIYLIKKGFDVEIITLHPGLFTKKGILLTKDQILNRFKELYGTAKLDKNKITLEYFIEFLEKGGKIKIKIPTKEDIIEEINQKRPVCALLTSNFLKGDKPVFNFHFNLVTGIDDKFVYVNDSLWDERGGKHKYLIDDFFYGIYAGAYGDFYDHSTDVNAGCDG